ncbi:hypothetical protein AAE478_001004 [Parahypoxylon ruwenzoriense]
MSDPPQEYQDDCSFCGVHRAANPRLCHDCQIWDIDEHIFTYKNLPEVNLDLLSSRNPPAFSIGERVHIDRIEDLTYVPLEAYGTRHSCIVCHEIYMGAVKKKLPLDTQICPLRPFAVGPLRFDREEKGLPPRRPYNIECVVPVVLKQRTRDSHDSENQGTESIYPAFAVEIIISYDESGQTLLDVHRWDRTFFSLDSINQWLSDCQETHGFDCDETVSPMSLPEGFRLIDTYDRCVVTPPGVDHYDFVTLSYVWASASDGKDTQLTLGSIELLSCPGSLTAQEVPSLIEDAIVLCSSLGQRYLWVDRLCIIQDDASSKHAQIYAMDAIYHLALFTIIALTNGKDSIGLPGSPNRPRVDSDLSHEWNFGRDGRGYCAYPRIDLVERSEWNTRGWTFQERLLSGRHLFVSSQQVLACCGKYTLNCNAPLSPEEISAGLDHGNRQDLERGVRQIRYYRKYRIIVAQYNTKRLSFDSDILNAFVGISQVVGFTLETSFIFGVPERFLLESLLWGPVGASRRRGDSLHIPSWSWAAWEGGVDYRPIQTFDAVGDQVGGLVAFHFVDKKRGLRRVDSYGHWFFESFDGPPSERPPGERFSMREWKDMMVLLSHRPDGLETWERCPHNPSETLRRLDIPADIGQFALKFPGSLVFNTTKATLSLRQPSVGGKHRVPIKNSDVNQEFLLICDGLSNPIGITMWMDRSWRKQTISLEQTHDFIVLGGGVQKYAKYDVWPYVSTDCPWCLYVMLVEKHNLVYRRVAIGAVVVNAWASLNPRWETIILS